MKKLFLKRKTNEELVRNIIPVETREELISLIAENYKRKSDLWIEVHIGVRDMVSGRIIANGVELTLGTKTITESNAICGATRTFVYKGESFNIIFLNKHKKEIIKEFTDLIKMFKKWRKNENNKMQKIERPLESEI